MTPLPPLELYIPPTYSPPGVGSLVWLSPHGYRAVIWFHGSVWGWPDILPAHLSHAQCYELLTECPTGWVWLGGKP